MPEGNLAEEVLGEYKQLVAEVKQKDREIEGFRDAMNHNAEMFLGLAEELKQKNEEIEALRARIQKLEAAISYAESELPEFSAVFPDLASSSEAVEPQQAWRPQPPGQPVKPPRVGPRERIVSKEEEDA